MKGGAMLQLAVLKNRESQDNRPSGVVSSEVLIGLTIGFSTRP